MSFFPRFAAALAVFFSTAVFSQAQSSASANDAAEGYVRDIDDARDQYAKGNQNAAFNVLVRSIDAKKNTGAWSLEAGTRLMHLATNFANCHDAANAKAAAIAAIATLTEAETAFVAEGKMSSAARAQELIGTVSECVLHDETSALSAYQRALKHNPNSAGAANAASRLNRSGKN